MPELKVNNSGTEIFFDITKISYKDTKILSQFISDQGKILPRRITGLNSKEQKRIAKLIKRARIAALMPFVIGKC